MTNVTIKRELLERIDETAICDGTDATISDGLFTQLVAALDTPRQPEGDGLEIRALEHNGITVSYRLASPHELRNGDPLCRLSDAQRAIAELRDRLDVMTQCADNYSRMFEESAEECERLRKESEKRKAQLNMIVRQGLPLEKIPDLEGWSRVVEAHELQAERDTLRQQLAELLEECERLRKDNLSLRGRIL